jgi:hypothetical protein
MNTGWKAIATLALAGVGAGGFWAARGDARAARALPHEGITQAPLPRIALSERDAAALAKIEITQPDWDGDGDRPPTVRLERRAEGWAIAAPLTARASASKVGALVDNLRSLTLHQGVARGTASYAAYHLSGEQAVHVVAWAGGVEVLDLYFGASDARGQYVRVAGTDAIFAMAASGPGAYQGFLYTRPLRSWRETSIFAFDPGDVVGVDVTNQRGRLSFARTPGAAQSWSASFAQRRGDGSIGAAAPRSHIDAARVDDLLGAYRSLAADDFGDDAQRTASGVDDAERTGGVVRIRLRGGGEHVLRVGRLATNTGRWAIAGSRWAVADDDASLYALAPWTADWAASAPGRFDAGLEPAASR